MSDSPPVGVRRRKTRVDGQRNRDRLIAEARRAFAEEGDGAVSLERIARAAEVGIATLYRHFPTREALVEAVYESELHAVTTLDPELLALRPDLGLRAWMNRYAGFVAAKRGMIDTLRSGWATGAIATPDTRQKVNAVIQRFLTAGGAREVLRRDVPADDVTAALLGAFLSTASGSDPGQLERLLDLLVDGLRPRS